MAVDAKEKPLPRIVASRRSTPPQGKSPSRIENTGLVWEYVKRCGDKFEEKMWPSVSQVVIHRGLLMAVATEGLTYCFDARTGERHWVYDDLAYFLASPLIVGDKVYTADEDGDVSIFDLSANPRGGDENGSRANWSRSVRSTWTAPSTLHPSYAERRALHRHAVAPVRHRRR